jgi:hypothetical protein
VHLRHSREIARRVAQLAQGLEQRCLESCRYFALAKQKKASTFKKQCWLVWKTL